MRFTFLAAGAFAMPAIGRKSVCSGTGPDYTVHVGQSFDSGNHCSAIADILQQSIGASTISCKPDASGATLIKFRVADSDVDINGALRQAFPDTSFSCPSLSIAQSNLVARDLTKPVASLTSECTGTSSGTLVDAQYTLRVGVPYVESYCDTVRLALVSGATPGLTPFDWHCSEDGFGSYYIQFELVPIDQAKVNKHLDSVFPNVHFKCPVFGAARPRAVAPITKKDVVSPTAECKATCADGLYIYTIADIPSKLNMTKCSLAMGVIGYGLPLAPFNHTGDPWSWPRVPGCGLNAQGGTSLDFLIQATDVSINALLDEVWPEITFNCPEPAAVTCPAINQKQTLLEAECTATCTDGVYTYNLDDIPGAFTIGKCSDAFSAIDHGFPLAPKVSPDSISRACGITTQGDTYLNFTIEATDVSIDSVLNSVWPDLQFGCADTAAVQCA